MAVYKVQQRADIWFETEVEANSPEEARDKAWQNEVVSGWEQLPDTVEFQDEFYILDTEDGTDDWQEVK
jgi:hypothetical protein